MKRLIAIVLSLGAGACFHWVYFATSVTLAGAEERAKIGGGAASYILTFMEYAAGPAILEISLWFWTGIALLIVAAFLLGTQRQPQE